MVEGTQFFLEFKKKKSAVREVVFLVLLEVWTSIAPCFTARRFLCRRRRRPQTSAREHKLGSSCLVMEMNLSACDCLSGVVHALKFDAYVIRMYTNF